MKLEYIFGTIIVIALLFALGAFTLGNIQQTQVNNTMEYNVTGQGLNAVGAFSDMLPIVVIIACAALLMFVIFALIKSSGKQGSSV